MQNSERKKNTNRGGAKTKPMKGPLVNSKKEIFTCSDITEITHNFKACIGQGGFGQVFLGDMNDGTLVAVKILSNSRKDAKDFSAEVKLFKIHHRNLVTLVGYCNEDAKKALIYEYIANGELLGHVSENSERSLPWNERLKIGEDIAEGINFLHGQKPPLIHRDLKPSNILLTEGMGVKIADFGLSRTFPTEFATHVSTRVAGTHGYLDPHAFASLERARKENDVYSFGIILLVLLTGKQAIIRQGQGFIHITEWISPVTESSTKINNESIQRIIDSRLQGEFDIHAAEKAIKLALSCVKSDITKRPDISRVLKNLKAISNSKGKTSFFTSRATLSLPFRASPNTQSQNLSYQEEYSDKPSFKVYCMTDPAFSLSIRDGKVILASTNASDPFQHWYKDKQYGCTVKDAEGVPSFALVNKATGQAIKHSIGKNHPVQLVSHNPNEVDKSVLWTEDRKSESGFKSIRMVTNTSLCIDILSDHVAEGTYLILCIRSPSSNQWWKIEERSGDLPLSSSANSRKVSYETCFSNKPTFKVYCKTDPNFCLSILGENVSLARTDPSDLRQHWYKDEKYGSRVKDEEGFPSFALVNKATRQAIKHSLKDNLPVRLVSHDPNKVDKSVLWTEDKESESGYKHIRMVTNTSLCVDIFNSCVAGAPVILYPRNFSSSQWWKIEQHSCDLPSSSSANSQSFSYQMGCNDKPSFKVYCKTCPQLSLSIDSDGKLILAPTNPSDLKQHWYKDKKNASPVKDKECIPSFALVNKTTAQAIHQHLVQLVSRNPNEVDKPVLWTEGNSDKGGYKSIQVATDTNLYMDAYRRYVILWPKNDSDNQLWKIQQHSLSHRAGYLATTSWKPQ